MKQAVTTALEPLDASQAAQSEDASLATGKVSFVSSVPTAQ
jgi:hypothetical protein